MKVLSLVCIGALLGVLSPAFAADATKYSNEELDQLTSPIALYPDDLVAQILMASTYPLEIVEAARWYKEHSSLSGNALQSAMQDQDWDPSVKSVVMVPDVLTMMNDHLDWTQDLGNAFLAQKQDVMQSVQRLRNKARSQGTLKSTSQQKVTYDSSTTIIQIAPTNPDVIYVPTYNPAVVYGTWPYPAYPPYAFYPYAGNVVSFGIGVAVGYALWGDCDWGRGDVNINVNNYNRFNHANIVNNRWDHDPYHRRGVGYKNPAVQSRYANRNPGIEHARDGFRGHEPGINRPGGIDRPGGGPNRPSIPNAPGGRIGGQGGVEHRMPNIPNAPRLGGDGSHPLHMNNGGGNIAQHNPGAFSGIQHEGSMGDSMRGHASMGSAPAPHFGGGGGFGGGGFHGGGGGGFHGGGGGFRRR